MHTSTLLALALAAAVAGTASAQTCGDTTVDCAAEDVNTEEMPADTPCRNCDAAECCAPPTSVGSGPPEGCTSWHDGCNTCQVMNGGATACTEMACARTTPPYCMAYVDGRECTDATTCSPAVDPVDPVDEESWSPSAARTPTARAGSSARVSGTTRSPSTRTSPASRSAPSVS